MKAHVRGRATHGDRRPNRRRPRKPGPMAGEIWIADDFDQLPREIAEAFGAAEPETRIYACAALVGGRGCRGQVDACRPARTPDGKQPSQLSAAALRRMLTGNEERPGTLKVTPSEAARIRHAGQPKTNTDHSHGVSPGRDTRG